MAMSQCCSTRYSNGVAIALFTLCTGRLIIAFALILPVEFHTANALSLRSAYAV
jgi:hypothetical protein